MWGLFILVYLKHEALKKAFAYKSFGPNPYHKSKGNYSCCASVGSDSIFGEVKEDDDKRKR